MPRNHWGHEDDGGVPYRSADCMTAELYSKHSKPCSIEADDILNAFSDLGNLLTADESHGGFGDSSGSGDSGGGDGGGGGGGGGD
ncbi:hypothetical protein FALCPG4_011264 [Fusarium falciforme]